VCAGNAIRQEWPSWFSVARAVAQASDAEVEARQLAAQLLGRPVDDVIMAELQSGVDSHAHLPGAVHGPGALLRRLRVAKKWGKASQDAAALATILEKLYWI
jgi:hypothetical protein